MRFFAAAFFLCLFQSSSSLAYELTVATWNLGWHVDKATAAAWVSKCNGLYEKDPNTGIWKASTTGAGVRGWQVNFREKVEWDWAKYPVCDVYKDRSFATVPVTLAAYDKRQQQLNDFLQNTLPNKSSPAKSSRSRHFIRLFEMAHSATRQRLSFERRRWRLGRSMISGGYSRGHACSCFLTNCGFAGR
jgi:hypothetical protein